MHELERECFAGSLSIKGRHFGALRPLDRLAFDFDDLITFPDTRFLGGQPPPDSDNPLASLYRKAFPIGVYGKAETTPAPTPIPGASDRAGQYEKENGKGAD